MNENHLQFYLHELLQWERGQRERVWNVHIFVWNDFKPHLLRDLTQHFWQPTPKCGWIVCKYTKMPWAGKPSYSVSLPLHLDICWSNLHDRVSPVSSHSAPVVSFNDKFRCLPFCYFVSVRWRFMFVLALEFCSVIACPFRCSFPLAHTSPCKSVVNSGK